MTTSESSRGRRRHNNNIANHNNPLSAARGKRDLEALWHRKTGAGYGLFVRYYAGQPPGVAFRADPAEDCCDVEGAPTTGTPNNSSFSGTDPLCDNKGMSRASKRRKKRQARNGGASEVIRDRDVGSKETSSTSAAPPRASSTELIHQNETSPLLSALERIYSKKPNAPLTHGLRGFLAALSKPLPITFRIRASVSEEQERLLQQELESFRGVLAPPLVIGSQTVYQTCSHLSKASLGRGCPELKAFLNARTSDGSIARQELGSVLPVLLLREIGAIRRGSRVLDLCASPGSKTLQALELVGPSGRVRANDIHPTRLQGLRDAVARSGLPGVHEMVKYSNLDATKFPAPTAPRQLYDAVLCDVPCSGDGTCRKDAHLLPHWSPNIGNALHETQVRILQRALQCVPAKGVVCYSTCSLNPVEDEAVVAAALRDTSVSVELLPLPTLDGLVLRPGIRRWRVADYPSGSAVESDDDGKEEEEGIPELRWFASYADAVGKGGMDRAVPTLWPPDDGFADWPMERCGRLLPQDHDSGGFFVALLRRTG